MKSRSLILAFAAAGAIAASFPAQAADWWPFGVVPDGPDSTTIEYVPLEKASKEWNLCVLIPHLKDSYWLANNYGTVQEARRLGVHAYTFQAGGYDQLSKQLSQFDDCIASNADAILVSPITEAGIAGSLKVGMEKGIPIIAVANPIYDNPITALITTDHRAKAFQSGKALVDKLGPEGGKVVAFPGPQNSGWAEAYLEGFQKALEGTKVEVIGVKWGEPGVAEQLTLIEDALQTYPEMTAIWGGAQTAEAAVGAIAEAGRPEIAIVSSWESQTTPQLINDGKIGAFATEYPVILARIGVDLAVRALEKKPIEFMEKHPDARVLRIVPGLVTAENIKTFDATQIYAPADWQPVFDTK
ncbi:MAG: TMAO reductase system periplasmic protein TorT [Rhizobiaceae bacterium]|nr:TMAO reductase system periplasmic protein TorT [Rhizobiaceae bacterium]